MTALAPVLQAFFTDRLIAQRQVSGHTVAAYRDTFRLLLAFAQARTGTAPRDLHLDDPGAGLIGAFPGHLLFSDAQDVHVGVVQGGHRRAGKTPPGGGGRGSGWTGWRRGGQSVAASSVIAVRAEDSSTMVLAVV